MFFLRKARPQNCNLKAVAGLSSVVWSYVTKYRMLMWFPSFIGVALVAITVVDLILFEQQKITHQQMLVNELVIFLISSTCTFLVFITGVMFAFKKQWKQCGIAALNIGVFFICFFIAAYNGVALLYAT